MDQLFDLAERSNPQKHWSRRADSNREPPDYKKRSRLVSAAWR
jgi:hypothetical protein